MFWKKGVVTRADQHFENSFPRIVVVVDPSVVDEQLHNVHHPHTQRPLLLQKGFGSVGPPLEHLGQVSDHATRHLLRKLVDDWWPLAGETQPLDVDQHHALDELDVSVRKRKKKSK